MLAASDLVIAGLSIGSGFLAGWLVRHRSSRTIRPICPCKHAISFHQEGTGRCQFMDRQEFKYNNNGIATSYRQVQCTCQIYAGPEVISALTMRPMTFREVTSDEE
ncbi:MAG: hypothetical protein ABWY93_22645 [Mycobacterium sp.]